MKTYSFSIARLGIRVTLPWELPESERFAPFAAETLSRVDLEICLSVAKELPAIPEGGLMRGLSYEGLQGQTRYRYHFLKPNDAPFALTEIVEGQVRLLVKEGFEEYFTTHSALWNRIDIEDILPCYDRILLHAAVIERDGRAILFCGESGAGKSTQARLWQEHRGLRIVNGDRAILEKTEAGFFAYGSPWAGSSGIYQNLSGRAALIAVPRKAPRNEAIRMTSLAAFGAVYPHIAHHRTDAAATERVMDLCLDLVEVVAVYQLDCRPDEGAVSVLEEVLP